MSYRCPARRESIFTETWWHLGGLPFKAENPLLLKQSLEAAALQHLLSQRSAVPARRQAGAAGSPISHELSQDIPGISQHLPLARLAALCVSKAVLTFIDVSKFCVCLNHLFGDISCVSEKASYGKKKSFYRDVSGSRSAEAAYNCFLVLFLKLILLSETFQQKPAETEITRVPGLIDGHVQSHRVIGFARVTV